MLGFQVHHATVSPQTLNETNITKKGNKEGNKNQLRQNECITIDASTIASGHLYLIKTNSLINKK
jgi:hypothetical protein